MILESITFPFEEIIRVVRSDFCKKIWNEWRREKDRRLRLLIGEPPAGIIHGAEYSLGCGSFESPFRSLLINYWRTELRKEVVDQRGLRPGHKDYFEPENEINPCWKGLKILLALDEPSVADRRCELWSALRLFMHDGPLSLASLDRTLRLAVYLNSPQPATIERNRADFTRTLLSKLKLWERPVDRMLLGETAKWWSIGVSDQDNAEFRRGARDVQLVAEMLHRQICSDDRYISAIAGLHEILQKTMNDADDERVFFNSLFRSETIDTLAKRWAENEDSIAPPEGIREYPVRLGKILRRLEEELRFPLHIVWLPGKLVKDDNPFAAVRRQEIVWKGEGDVPSPIEDGVAERFKTVPKVKAIELVENIELIDLTRLYLFWPDTEQYRDMTFQKNVVAAIFYNSGRFESPDKGKEEIQEVISNAYRNFLEGEGFAFRVVDPER